MREKGRIEKKKREEKKKRKGGEEGRKKEGCGRGVEGKNIEEGERGRGEKREVESIRA